MVVARPVLVRVLPGQDLAPAGTPMIWTDPGQPRHGSRPDKSPMAEPGDSRPHQTPGAEPGQGQKLTAPADSEEIKAHSPSSPNTS